MLEVKNLSVSYGLHRALADVSLTVKSGEIVVILGANGAGKSSLLRAVGGISEGSVSGDVMLDNQTISGAKSHEIVERGLALVPEGRGVFPDLSVHENLLLGAYTKRARAEQASNMDRLLTLFPKLAERRTQMVRTMSGGEQQMVAIGRAIMSAPTILMLDEPSLGLSPLLCKELFASLSEIRDSGLGLLVVEQNAKQSLAIADRGYLLENTQITGEGSAAELANDPAVQAAYLGVSDKSSSSTVQPHDDQDSAASTPGKSPLPFITPSGVPGRPPTAGLISESISDLVRHAADAHGTSTGDLAGKTSSGSPLNGGADRLQQVLGEIERAAVAARSRATGNKSVKKMPPETKSAETPDAGDLPEIEIYRRSNGKLKRLKGKGHGQDI